MASLMRSNNTLNSTTTEYQTPDFYIDSHSVTAKFILVLGSLICVSLLIFGIYLLSRRACDPHAPRPPPRGLAKSEIRKLPKFVFNADGNWLSTECSVCLTDFTEGVQMRVLQECGHGFHLACVDTWLQTHSSCPSCRSRVVAVDMCKRSSCVTCSVTCSTNSIDLESGSGSRARENAAALP